MGDLRSCILHFVLELRFEGERVKVGQLATLGFLLSFLVRALCFLFAFCSRRLSAAMGGLALPGQPWMLMSAKSVWSLLADGS